MAIIHFRHSIDGFKDAEAFENSFYKARRGRYDYERDREKQLCGKHLYGWMATSKVCTLQGSFDCIVVRNSCL